MRKSPQNRTEDIKIPQVNYSSNSSPRGTAFPKPYYTWRCHQTLQDYPSTLIRVWAEALHMRDSKHKKFHPWLRSRWSRNTWHVPQGIRKVTNRSNTQTHKHKYLFGTAIVRETRRTNWHTNCILQKCHSCNGNGRSDTPKLWCHTSY